MSLIDDLRKLRPLQKRHYASNPDYTDADREVLEAYARLAHGLTVAGEWATPDQVAWACDTVRRLLESGDRRATLSVHWGHFGDEKHTELERRLETIQEAAFAVRVPIGAVVFDCEAQHPSAEVEHRVHLHAYQTAIEAGAERVIWYNRGGVVPAATATGWHTSVHFDLTEPGDGLSCALYRVPEIETTREQFRRTVENAGLGRNVTCFVALGSGYRRTTTSMAEWAYDWPYDPIYSWQLGAEINEPWFGDRPARFAPWHRCLQVCFYPPPFAYPLWAEHFLAYVRGANGTK